MKNGGRTLLYQVRNIDGFIVSIFEDYHRNMWVGKFNDTMIPNAYGDTQSECYREIYNNIAKYKGLPLPYPDKEYKEDGE